MADPADHYHYARRERISIAVKKRRGAPVHPSVFPKESCE